MHFLLERCLFLGIPGICSHEKGTWPEWRGVEGLKGELFSSKENEARDELDDEKEGEEERESVLREDGRGMRGENRE